MNGFELFISGITLAQFWLFGWKNRFIGFVYAVLVSLCWMWFSVSTEQWGLMPLAIGLIMINTYNALKHLPMKMKF